MSKAKWERWCKHFGIDPKYCPFDRNLVPADIQEAVRVQRSWEEFNRFEDVAAEGRAIQQRELDVLDDLLIAPAVDAVLSALPGRIATRGRAGAILAAVRENGSTPVLRHGKLIAEPTPPAPLAELFEQHAGEIGDLLDEQGDI